MLDEPEAKAAMIWIIGQYADRIENSEELLEDFLYTFLEEPTEVSCFLRRVETCDLRARELTLPSFVFLLAGPTGSLDRDRQALHPSSNRWSRARAEGFEDGDGGG